MKKIILLVALALTGRIGFAQVTITPVFATQTDSIVVIYDATQGNAALVGESQIYAHTGVITDLSNGPTDWRHVQGNWGTPDPKVKMTNLGNDKHMLTYKIDTYYGVPASEIVSELAFVFRNASGSVVGRATDGSDIYVPIYQGGFNIAITSPVDQPLLLTLNDSVLFEVAASDTSQLKLFVDDSLMLSVNATTASIQVLAADFGPGKHWLWYEATENSVVYTDSVYYMVNANEQVLPPPPGVQDGMTVTGTQSVVFQLFAPFKNFVYLIGDFNDWQLDPQYRLFRSSTDSTRFWIELNNLDPNREYRFQYFIDNEGMRVGDIYADKVLDPWNDPWIPEDVYPNLIGYPTGKTTGMVTTFTINETEYIWQSTGYTPPERDKLIIYELIVRDFVHKHSYQAIEDTLNYLQNLGINAIELMPVNEFEGNISWGYNPSFYFAPDKYYGTKNALKSLIDACHKRGIAVILDMVLNHSFGSNPQVQMYFDPNAGQWGQPTAQNPWFNQVPKHDFNVGYDYNHESPHTKAFVKRVFKYWVEEFRVDGYRLDLSKGYTQKNTLGNTAAWGQYDQSRIDILTDYANALWADFPDAWMILEHFAENSEEKVLSQNGMMPWGNEHWQYKEAGLGYPADFSGISYQNRGWSEPNLIGYYTSHDEERLMFENLNYGNSAGGYNVKDFTTALQRMEMINVFLLLVPGPKMLYEFDELGYDFPINYCEDGTINPGCRTAPKPIKWDFTQNTSRARLFKITRALNLLKRDYDVFSTTDFSNNFSAFGKRLKLNNAQMNVLALGNFNVLDMSVVPKFQHTGTWYDYFSGDSISVSDVDAPLNFAPGEYHIYTDVKLPLPDLSPDIPFDFVLSVEEGTVFGGQNFQVNVYPNPVANELNFGISTTVKQQVKLVLSDLTGSVVYETAQTLPAGNTTITVAGSDLTRLPSGVFIYTITSETGRTSGKIIITR